MTLTGFMREVQGTENWLIRQGLKFEQTAQELWELAVDALSTLDSEHEESIEEKAERILETIDLEGCDIRDEAARRSRYNYLAKGSPQPFSNQHPQPLRCPSCGNRWRTGTPTIRAAGI